jgi:hypothetical protein
VGYGRATTSKQGIPYKIRQILAKGAWALRGVSVLGEDRPLSYGRFCDRQARVAAIRRNC